MAAAALRRSSIALTTINLTTIFTVPASRALVISKMIVTSTGTGTFNLYVGGQPVAMQYSMTPGQVYAETGVVAIAGDNIQIIASVASIFVITVCGEEVDN